MGYHNPVSAVFWRQFMHDIAPYTLSYLTHGNISPATYTGAILPFPQQYPKCRRWKISLEIAGKVCRIKNNPYLCCRNIDLVQTKIRHPSLSGCLFFFKRHIFYSSRGEVLYQGGPKFLQVPNRYKMKRRTRPRIVRISTRVEVVRLVKVRSYKRIRKGKVERVRSHYRRY